MNDSQEYEEYCYLSVSGLNGIEESLFSTFVSPRDARRKRCSASFGGDFSAEKLPLQRKTRNRIKKQKAQVKIMNGKKTCRSLFTEEISKGNNKNFETNGIKKVIHYREQTVDENTQKKKLSKTKMPEFSDNDGVLHDNLSVKKREKSLRGKRVSGKQQSLKISHMMLKSVRSKLGKKCMGVKAEKKLEKLKSKKVMAATLDVREMKKKLSGRKIEKSHKGGNYSICKRKRSIESKLENSNDPQQITVATIAPKNIKLVVSRSNKPQKICKESAPKKKPTLIKSYLKNKQKITRHTKMINAIENIQKETNRISSLTALDLKNKSTRDRKTFLHKKKNSLILKLNPIPKTSRFLLKAKDEEPITLNSFENSFNQEDNSFQSYSQPLVYLAQALCRGYLMRKQYKDEQYRLKKAPNNFTLDIIAGNIPNYSNLQSKPMRIAKTLSNLTPLQISPHVVDSTQDSDPFAETIALLLSQSSKNLPTQSESSSNFLILSPNTSDRELSSSEEIVFESCNTFNSSVNDLSFSLVKDSAKSARASVFDIDSPISIDSPTKIVKISADFISDLAEALIYTMLSESLSKPLTHGIDQSVEIYISQLNEVIKPYKSQHNFLISNSTQSESLLILSSLQDYTDYPYIPPLPINSFLSPSLFAELNIARIKFSSTPEVSDCQQAHDRLLFDNFNESLQSFRPQFLQSLALSTSTQKIPINKPSLATSLLKSLELLKSLNSFKAGKLEDPSILPHEALLTHREEKINQLIFNDIISLDHLWVSYTLEETQVIFELCDQILESFLTELLPILL